MKTVPLHILFLKIRCVASETRLRINKNLANLIWEIRGETDDPHHSRLFKTIDKLVERATLPGSRVSYHDLDAIAFDGATADVQPPCLIIIGRSVLMGRRLPSDFTDERDLPESGVHDSKPVLTVKDWSVSQEENDI